jgi:hypothetical protein
MVMDDSRVRRVLFVFGLSIVVACVAVTVWLWRADKLSESNPFEIFGLGFTFFFGVLTTYLGMKKPDPKASPDLSRDQQTGGDLV